MRSYPTWVRVHRPSVNRGQGRCRLAVAFRANPPNRNLSLDLDIVMAVERCLRIGTQELIEKSGSPVHDARREADHR
jgi:hypothetical protein